MFVRRAKTGLSVHLVEITGLDIRLGGATVLHDVSMHIEKSEIITVVGPNGSGKTTLLRTIIGAIKPSRGQIAKRSGLQVGYVPQRLHIDTTFPMTVRRFLSLPRSVSNVVAEEALAEAGVANLKESQMSKLSGGQFQRVLLARALLGRPDLLLLDEATQGLDQPGSAAFTDRLKRVVSVSIVLYLWSAMNCMW